MLQGTWESRYLFKILFSFSFGIYPKEGLLDHTVSFLCVANKINSGLLLDPQIRLESHYSAHRNLQANICVWCEQWGGWMRKIGTLPNVVLCILLNNTKRLENT